MVDHITDYIIEDRYIYNSVSTTKGTQVKYKKDDYFYKIDKMGREEFVTVHSLYQKYTGNSDFANHLMTKRSAEERLEEILDLVDGFGISREDFRHYMNVLVQLDLLIENTDRHVHNYGVIMSNKKGFSMAPIFDNGRALCTDNSNIFSACTLSGSFEEQVTAFGYPVKACFTIDYPGFYDELTRIEQIYGKCVEITTLKNRLEEYKYIFKS